MTQIIIGTGTCGVSAGAQDVVNKFRSLLDAHKLQEVTLSETGCLGMCYKEVLVEVSKNNKTFLYGDITPAKAEKIVAEHILQNKPVTEYLAVDDRQTGPESDFISKQKRIVLARCGQINPDSIEDYLHTKGYQALDKTLKHMTPDEVIQTILDSKLRGRGGAGFLTGQKWRFARQAVGDTKYVICNADEGDPGAFMDRSVLESDPHSVLEGMLICGFAIGADHGYIYCRAEYPKAISKLKQAIKQATERGYLGENILGTNFSFHIKIKEGAGAFVCGEETALIASIEGHRGTPRVRPPYPAVSGLWGKPTNINNVETFANVAWIILNGAESFASIGTADSKGTKVFAMAGKVKRSGLVEVPMGITIHDIVFGICGGIVGDKKFKAVQMGGPSGGCVPAALDQTPIDYQRINETGAIMGSGGMIVVDETVCMVELARFFLEFTQRESCGKCTSCRIGTLRMLETLENIVAGKGKPSDIDDLISLGEQIKATSQCGLGQTAPNPVLTTIRYFREEYDAHIQQKCCPAHSCAQLVNYVIDPTLCTGCGICLRDCPSQAITGAKKAAHTIDTNLCSKCGKCITACHFNAINKI